MNSKSRFLALEIMCLQQARTAEEEAKYWLAEAEEWSQLRLACAQRQAGQNASTGLAQFIHVDE